MQDVIHMWYFFSQEKRRLFRLTLQAISRVAQKRQKLALRQWHIDASERRCSQLFHALEEARADTLLNAHTEGMEVKRDILQVPSDWLGMEENKDILQFPSDWLDLDSALSIEENDSWDLIADCSVSTHRAGLG
jgi:hypothetical protein